MGLFQRRPIVGDNLPIYTTGMQQTVLIIGLGNIGDKYQGTRHNIGFAVLDHFADKQGFEGWIAKSNLHSAITQHTLGSTRVILCKPTTYMNESGRALQAVQHYYKIANSSTLVVHDELDIDFGQIRIRSGGGAAGHNGIKSLIQSSGDDFKRVRIGVGPKTPEQIDSADFVLAHFTKKEQGELPLLLQETNAILSEYCYGAGELPDETRSFLV